ncbi:acyltransferase [Hymenobacter sp. BRD128]|uniref:acyltransferase family protein n=1 Tax=Hymenobacter sp. BRD128 TaxID=2675878 RepID=UPI001564BBC4|nr:acyltransferase [Hymenobacter sp. BRD128]QKG56059.1 acyltransferase [Hymenobacter sp. BRD128]
MKSSSPPTAYYPALTGLRALAALAVFCFHQHPPQLAPVTSLATAGLAVLSELHIGVSIFFTLSGYLITRRYAGQRFGVADWGRYLGHRVARIMPVYAVLLTAVFVGRLVKIHLPFWKWLGLYFIHLSLANGLVERWALSGIVQAWSLSVEEGFYALAPVVFWLGGRYGPRRAWPGLALGLAAVGLGLYSMLPALGSPLFMLKGTIFGRLTEFLIGAAFAWRPPQLRHRWATGGGALGLAAVLGLLVLVQYLMHHISLDTYPGVAINNLLLPVATGWLLHGLAHERTRASRLLSTPAWQLLGRASYCFYLIHMGPLANGLEARLAPRLPALLLPLALLGPLVLAALALYFGLERPAHRWLLAWFGRRGLPHQAATPARHQL